MRFTNRATKRRTEAIKLQFKEIMCMFKDRRANFIIAIACNRDSGVEELFKLYWLCGRDAADYFFEKFGPPVFCLEHRQAEKKMVIDMMQTVVRGYTGQWPGLSEAQICGLDTLAETIITVSFGVRLDEWQFELDPIGGTTGLRFKVSLDDHDR